MRLGVRVPDRPSSFKRALSGLKVGDALFGSNLGGAFTMPRDATRKLAFVAGGIGITPFRSMAQSLVDRGENRDVVLVHACRSESDFVYRDVFGAAETRGLRSLRIVGRLSSEAIAAEIPDFLERDFYLSGPPGMVQSYRETLRVLGVRERDILMDFFSGH